MSKMSMQEFANAIGVSRITVWKALSNRPGVSEALREKIRQQAAEMGLADALSPEDRPRRKRTVSVAVSRPESSSFWMQIIHHIAKELSANGIELMYTYMPSTYKSGYTLPPSLDGEGSMGVIVLNLYDAELLRMLAAQPLPKVFLDTVPSVPFGQLNGDLMMLEGRDIIRRITARLMETGRKRLGFIGDVAYAQTNTDRYLGFLDAHAAMGVTPDERCHMTGPIGLRSHYEEISRFLDSVKILPDGFVCASDFIAHFVQRYLGESGRVAPEDFILTGFDNNIEYGNVAERITTVDVQTSTLGKRLARRIMFLADYPDASHELSYISSEILYRGLPQG